MYNKPIRILDDDYTTHSTKQIHNKTNDRAKRSQVPRRWSDPDPLMTTSCCSWSIQNGYVAIEET